MAILNPIYFSKDKSSAVLNSNVDESEQSASRSSRFTGREGTPCVLLDD
jgi:hypothetical protein